MFLCTFSGTAEVATDSGTMLPTYESLYGNSASGEETNQDNDPNKPPPYYDIVDSLIPSPVMLGSTSQPGEEQALPVDLPPPYVEEEEEEAFDTVSFHTHYISR